MKRTLVTLLFVAGVVALGSLIGLLNMPGPWYQGLAKPAFNPPNWIFGPVWTVLYAFIGVAGARTFLDHRHSQAMRLWVAQMVLNFAWSPMFFGAEQILGAFIIVIAMLIAILLFIRASWHQDRLSALLFLPYAAWVAFASLLNGSILYLN
ncbi:TspO and MBR related proteins [Rhizobium sp. RU20A]|uniref:TspO/MBR family protein n=1 Tax=Rhizobium sp. RU20A TaxID=1907412 RepID=UPI0009560A20|nr:TspO/MBR family protein [Rhizobium sp. RU20A]SIQ73277.1 TspO and MBR related proteins [Rhizobium sp. RU20A]